MPARARQAWLSWSSGKDSAWALHVVRQQWAGRVEVTGLFTTLNAAVSRVAMHGVRDTVLRAQAAHAGLPLHEVPLPWPCSNEHYECAMRACLERARAADVEVMVFGDLFLEDVRAYRERQLSGTGIEPLFPLWGLPTDRLAREMIAAGVRATLVCVDSAQIDPGLAGRAFDASLLRDLPAHADPCGERGEFHTCVHAGPFFSSPLDVCTGETVVRGPFIYTDILVIYTDILASGAATRPEEAASDNCRATLTDAGGRSRPPRADP